MQGQVQALCSLHTRLYHWEGDGVEKHSHRLIQNIGKHRLRGALCPSPTLVQANVEATCPEPHAVPDPQKRRVLKGMKCSGPGKVGPCGIRERLTSLLKC